MATEGSNKWQKLCNKLDKWCAQLFGKYMLARLNSRQFCTSEFTPFGCFWLSQGVYPGYTFGYPPKVGVTVRYVKLYFHLVFQKLLTCENIGAEKVQKFRYFNLSPNTCGYGVHTFGQTCFEHVAFNCIMPIRFQITIFYRASFTGFDRMENRTNI